MGVKQSIGKYLINVPGWRTGQKIVVIESDDWGSIRISSKEALERLKKSGLAVDRCYYMLNDALASEEDISRLFEVLQKHRNNKDQTPVITANCLMANPDFEKIRASNFQEYYFEHFTKTLERYPKHKHSFKLWQEGISEGLFYPQSHGREHLNITRWMLDLQKGIAETRLAFDLGIFGISGHISRIKRGSYLAAFDGEDHGKFGSRATIIGEALNLFNQTFGYESLSFIAPNYVWDDEVERCLADHGVRYLQGSTVQHISKSSKEQHKTNRHYQGQKNKFGQRYLMRNAHFEPSSSLQKDWVNSCLKEIATAFLFKKPAVIATHRVNFVGFINPANRDRNLILFDELLKCIIDRWPEVEFLTSDQLGNAINGNHD